VEGGKNQKVGKRGGVEEGRVNKTLKGTGKGVVVRQPAVKGRDPLGRARERPSAGQFVSRNTLSERKKENKAGI